MVAAGIAAVGRSCADRADNKMRRVIAIAVAGTSLAGCSSLSWDSFKPTPPSIQVQLESNPQGADAKTSLGPGCKTPCSVTVPAPESGFTVTYTLDKFLPATVPVQVVHNSGAFNNSPPVVMDPDPVVGELQPAPPPPKATKRMRPRKPRGTKSPKAAASPAADPSDSAFPNPNAPRR
jgi:hypothetical protein